MSSQDSASEPETGLTLQARLSADYNEIRGTQKRLGEALPHFFELPQQPELDEKGLIPIAVPQSLSDYAVKQFELQGYYPYWKVGSRRDNGHPLIGAGRSLGEHTITRSVIALSRELGRRLKVVDVGSNVERLRASFRLNGFRSSDCDTHHLVPEQQPGDAARQRAGVFHRHCTHLLEKCTCEFVRTCDVLIFQHSLYYFGPNYLLAALTGGRVAYATVHHLFGASGNFYQSGESSEMQWHVETDGYIAALARGNQWPYRHPDNGWMQAPHYTDGARTLFWEKIETNFETHVYKLWTEDRLVPQRSVTDWFDPLYVGRADQGWIHRLKTVSDGLVSANAIGPNVSSSSEAYVVGITGITMRYGTALIHDGPRQVIAIPTGLIHHLAGMCTLAKRDHVLLSTLRVNARRILISGGYPLSLLPRAVVLSSIAAMSLTLEEETARVATHNKRFGALIQDHNLVMSGKPLARKHWYTPFTRFFQSPFAACSTDEHDKEDALDVGLRNRPLPPRAIVEKQWPSPSAPATTDDEPLGPQPPPEHFVSPPPSDDSSTSDLVTENIPARFSKQIGINHEFPGYTHFGNLLPSVPPFVCPDSFGSDSLGSSIALVPRRSYSPPKLLRPNEKPQPPVAGGDSLHAERYVPVNFEEKQDEVDNREYDHREDVQLTTLDDVCVVCGGMRCTCDINSQADTDDSNTSYRSVYSTGNDPVCRTPVTLGLETFDPVSRHKSNVPPPQKESASFEFVVPDKYKNPPQYGLRPSLIVLGCPPTCTTATIDDVIRGFQTRVGRATPAPLLGLWAVKQNDILSGKGFLGKLKPPRYLRTMEKDLRWIDQQPGHMKERYLQAFESLKSEPLRRSDCRAQVFIKAERSTHLTDRGDPKADPRLITSFSPRRQLVTGPFHKHYAAHLRKAFPVRVGSACCWVNGPMASADGFGKWYDAAVKSFGGRPFVVKWGDQEKFEAHRNGDAWEVLVTIQVNACDDLDFITAMMETKVLRALGTSHPIKIKVEFVLSAGVSETSVDNFVRNVTGGDHSLGPFKWGENMYAGNGDDFVNLRLESIDVSDEDFHKRQAELGFECTIQSSKNPWDAEFCQMIPYPTSEGTVWGPKIGRVLARLPWQLITTKDDPRGVALGMLTSCFHIPFLREYLLRIESLSPGVKPIPYLHRPTTRRRYTNSAETWDFVRHRYGLGLDDLTAFVKHIKTCRLNQACSWPLLQQLVEIDQ